MDWKTLFLDPKGRMGQKDFWIGWLILFCVGLILGWLTMGFPLVNQVISLALIYPGVCIYSKRLHDLGKTGWLAAIPYGLSALVTLMALATTAGLLSGMATGNGGLTAGAMAGVAGMGLFGLVSLIVIIGFLLWLGLSKGDPGDNQYGPPPRPLIGGGAHPA